MSAFSPGENAAFGDPELIYLFVGRIFWEKVGLMPGKEFWAALLGGPEFYIFSRFVFPREKRVHMQSGFEAKIDILQKDKHSAQHSEHAAVLHDTTLRYRVCVCNRYKICMYTYIYIYIHTSYCI